MQPVTFDEMSFRYSHSGYMLYYRGCAIGGAGVLDPDKPKHWKHKAADIAQNQKAAEFEIRQIVAGRIPSFMRSAIQKVQQGNDSDADHMPLDL